MKSRPNLLRVKFLLVVQLILIVGLGLDRLDTLLFPVWVPKIHYWIFLASIVTHGLQPHTPTWTRENKQNLAAFFFQCTTPLTSFWVKSQPLRFNLGFMKLLQQKIVDTREQNKIDTTVRQHIRSFPFPHTSTLFAGRRILINLS